MVSRFGACALAAVLIAQNIVATALSASEVRHESFSSNYLGQDLSFLAYLPNGYEDSKARYPVLYLLHGYGDNERAWVEKGAIKKKADHLIASGAIPPAIIIMPGCAYCWWADGRQLKSETAFWEELVPEVASKYRTIESREGRVIAGPSAGGYGAIRLSLKYSNRFAAVAALSPAIYSQTPPEQSAARVRSPFLDPDGNFNEKAWTKHNYPSLIDRYFTQGDRIPIYLVSGDHDSFGITYETALFYKRVAEKQPTLTELRVVDGGHSWAVWSNAVDDAMRYIFSFASRPVDESIDLIVQKATNK